MSSIDPMPKGNSDIACLITGAAGFLGLSIVAQAAAFGIRIRATDRVCASLFPGIDYCRADILDPDSLDSMMNGVDCVCHAAGLAHIFNKAKNSGAPFHTINVVGAENVAQAAARNGVKNFVYISSVSVYGGISRGSNERQACHPEGPYAESKLQAEQRLGKVCQREGMNLAILRLATLYGEEDPGNVARLIHTIDRGRFIWAGRGENLKSLLHHEDAARACLAVIMNPVAGIHIYNVVAPARRMKDIVAIIALALGRDVSPWHVPVSLALYSARVIKYLSSNHGRFSTIHATLQKWLADDYYSMDKFCETFNYQTEVSLEEGIKREVAWYKTGKNRKQA